MVASANVLPIGMHTLVLIHLKRYIEKLCAPWPAMALCYTIHTILQT